jgi:multidrug efflux system outer membrane protein
MKPRRTLAALAAASLLAACATSGPSSPALDLPTATGPAPTELDRWWTLFNDARLTALIEEALANNLDLRAAVARIDEARANLRLAHSALFPSLDATAGANRSKRSAATELPQGPPFASTTYNLGLAAAYEIDLWGKLRSGRAAADADLLATRFAAQTVRIALAAQVATAYFALRALDAELALTSATLATRDENVRLQLRRREAGVASEFEFAQAEAERAAVATAVPPLERAAAQTAAALALLAGRSARAVFTPQVARGIDLDKLDPGPEVPPGLPSDLLERRPDVRRASAALVAADARLAEARAQYFPSLALTASFGGESAALSDLLASPARVWSVAAGLVQPIIGIHRVDAQVDAAAARREQAALGYQQAVQAAFRDVHDALVAHRGARAALAAQEQRRAKLAEALRLAELRHRTGYSSYLEVLDAQRGLLAAERERIAALRDRQIALVDLYKALGGGWTNDAFAAR